MLKKFVSSIILTMILNFFSTTDTVFAQKVLISQEDYTNWYIYTETFKKYTDNYFSVIVETEGPENAIRTPVEKRKIVTDAWILEFKNFKQEGWKYKTDQTGKFYSFDNIEKIKAAYDYCRKNLYSVPDVDTYILTSGSVEIYVKADSFYRTDIGNNFDAAPQFECDLINVNRQSGRSKTYHSVFLAKGMVIMRTEGNNEQGDFVNALYNEICRKLIYKK